MRKSHYTITEAAKELEITRAAVHRAIKDGRLESEWGEVTQVIKTRAKLIPADSLKTYRVSERHQWTGKKTD